MSDTRTPTATPDRKRGWQAGIAIAAAAIVAVLLVLPGFIAGIWARATDRQKYHPALSVKTRKFVFRLGDADSRNSIFLPANTLCRYFPPAADFYKREYEWTRIGKTGGSRIILPSIAGMTGTAQIPRDTPSP